MNSLEAKILKTSKRVSTFLKVGSLLMLFVAVLLFIGGVVLTLVGTELRESFLAEYSVIANNGTVLNVNPQNLLWVFVFLILHCGSMFVILYSVHQIFKNVSEEGTPFQHKHVVRIKRVAFMILFLSVIGGFSDGFLSLLFTQGEQMWSIELSGLILAVVVYCLALFFDYGCKLQKQSDETL